MYTAVLLYITTQCKKTQRIQYTQQWSLCAWHHHRNRKLCGSKNTNTKNTFWPKKKKSNCIKTSPRTRLNSLSRQQSYQNLTTVTLSSLASRHVHLNPSNWFRMPQHDWSSTSQHFRTSPPFSAPSTGSLLRPAQSTKHCCWPTKQQMVWHLHI